MNDLWVLDVGKEALTAMLMVGGPLLLVALLVGLLVSVFQALTQINEATLTFIPKILAIGGTLLIMGPWMIRILTSFTSGLYQNMSVHIR